jgi:ureidoacrylate peracid hydrolase
MNANSTALVLIDLQNDVLDPDGAFTRGNFTTPEMRAVVSRVAPAAKALKARKGFVAASLFTLWPDGNGEPMFSQHNRNLRGALRKGDFAPSSWGQATTAAITPFVDVTVFKVSQSAFFNTPLDWILRHAGADTLAFAGIATNASVAATVRDAHLRDYHCVVLADGCAAFNPAAHEAGLNELKPLAHIMTCAEFVQQLS